LFSWSIIKDCWSTRPKDRPTFIDIVQKLLPIRQKRFDSVSFFFSQQRKAGLANQSQTQTFATFLNNSLPKSFSKFLNNENTTDGSEEYYPVNGLIIKGPNELVYINGVQNNSKKSEEMKLLQTSTIDKLNYIASEL
jgi:hypothetical protein